MTADSRSAHVLAVDLGGTRMRAAIVDSTGSVLDHRVARTPHRSHCPDALLALVGDVLAHHRVSTAVVGLPGRVNYDTGQLEHAPNLPTGWSASLTEDTLSEVLGLPVAIANDADMAAVGEATFGAGRGFADVVYITISTGMGAGVVLGGHLVRGTRSLAEIGHTVIDRVAAGRGQPATVEELASGTAMAHHAAVLELEAEGAELVALVDGDHRARTVWNDAVHVAGLAIANLAHLFAPEVVVVGGGVGRSGETLLAPIRDLLAAHGPRGQNASPLVVSAALGDDAGLVGAAGWHVVTARMSSPGRAEPDVAIEQDRPKPVGSLQCHHARPARGLTHQKKDHS